MKQVLAPPKLMAGVYFKAQENIEVLDEYEGESGQFLKTFALNDVRNKNGWRAVWQGIQNNIHTFKDRPGIEFVKCDEDGCDLDHTEAQTKEASLEVQEPFRVTTIVGYTLDENNRTAYFVHKVNDPEFFKRVKAGEIKYVSPSIWPKTGGYEIIGYREDGTPLIDVWDWDGLHDAYVNKPAFGDDAKITATCEGQGCPVKLLSAAELKERFPKVTQSEANYRKATDDRKCSNCRFFKEGYCQVVEGQIDPNFTSDRFVPIAQYGIVDQGDLSHLQEIPLLVNHNKKKRFMSVNQQVYNKIQKLFESWKAVDESKVFEIIRQDKENSSFNSCTCSANQTMPDEEEYKKMESRIKAMEDEKKDLESKLVAQDKDEEKQHEARKARYIATFKAMDEEDREKMATAIRGACDEKEVKAMDEAEKEVKTAKGKHGQQWDEDKKETDAKIAALESKLSEPIVTKMVEARQLNGASVEQIDNFKKSLKEQSLKAIEERYESEKILTDKVLAAAEESGEKTHFPFEAKDGSALSGKSLEDVFDEVFV